MISSCPGIRDATTRALTPLLRGLRAAKDSARAGCTHMRHFDSSQATWAWFSSTNNVTRSPRPRLWTSFRTCSRSGPSAPARSRWSSGWRSAIRANARSSVFWSFRDERPDVQQERRRDRSRHVISRRRVRTEDAGIHTVVDHGHSTPRYGKRVRQAVGEARRTRDYGVGSCEQPWPEPALEPVSRGPNIHAMKRQDETPPVEPQHFQGHDTNRLQRREVEIDDLRLDRPEPPVQVPEHDGKRSSDFRIPTRLGLPGWPVAGAIPSHCGAGRVPPRCRPQPPE